MNKKKKLLVSTENTNYQEKMKAKVEKSKKKAISVKFTETKVNKK